ncbi:hypothetical protein TNCV_5067181 [Trichonephila clavipes]|nr:hypothetical protein TNCV_5067181 [Trichonephila clavipes]
MDHIRAKNEDIQKARLTVLGIVRIEQLSQLKEKIQRHFGSPSERHGMLDDERGVKQILEELVLRNTGVTRSTENPRSVRSLEMSEGLVSRGSPFMTTFIGLCVFGVIV